MDNKKALPNGEIVIKTDDGIYFHASNEYAIPLLIDKEEGEKLMNDPKEES